MRHYFDVINYCKEMECHTCKDEAGAEYFIDLMIDFKLEQDKKVDPEELVGKRVSVSYTKPFVSIGYDVKIEDKE